MLTRVNRIRLIFALLIATLFGLIYFKTMPLDNVSYLNSDLLVTVAADLGVNPPPGYPLYTLILHLFLKLPLSLSPAAKGHLLSVIFSAAALGVTFISLCRLHQLLLSKQAKKNKFLFNFLLREQLVLAFMATAAIGFNGLFWRYAVITHPNALSGLFVSMLVFGMVSIAASRSKPKASLRSLLFLTAVMGLAVSHELSLALLLPGLLYLIYREMWPISLGRVVIAIACAACFFAAPFLLLLYYHSRQTGVSWPLTPTLSGLVTFVRQSNVLSLGTQQEFFTTGLQANATFDQALTSLIEYGKHLGITSGWWLLPIIGLGLFFGWQRYQRQVLPFFIAYAFLGALLAAYVRHSADWHAQALIYSQFVPGLIILPVIIFIGLYEGLRRLSNFFTVLFRPKIAAGILFILIVTVIVWQASSQYQTANLRGYNLVHERYQNILSSVKSDALITCFSETACNALLYEHVVNSVRPDIDIIPLAFPLVSRTISQGSIRGFTYDRNPFFLLDVISWNLDSRPVYAVELTNYHANIIGLDYPYMYFIPQGYYGELSRSIPKELPPLSTPLTDAWLKTPTHFADPMLMQHKSTPARDHMFNGLNYNKMLLRDRSLAEFNQAANIFFQFDAGSKKEFTGLRAALEQNRSVPAYKPGSKVSSAAEQFKLIPKLLEQKMFQKALTAAVAALTVDPKNPRSHLVLADIFERMGDLPSAKREYFHVLMLEPQHSEAQKKFQELSR